MSIKLSKLFGMDIYTGDAEYKGKVYDIIINLEKGCLETITTDPLKVKTKSDAKKILSEKSIPYKNVKAAKDILLVSKTGVPESNNKREEKNDSSRTRYRYRR
jgi:sporulation protein YlmC with PRC-barrel domain